MEWSLSSTLCKCSPGTSSLFLFGAAFQVLQLCLTFLSHLVTCKTSPLSNLVVPFVFLEPPAQDRGHHLLI